MALKWKKEDTEKLIYAMQQHPCLFNKKSAEYLDRSRKAQAFNEVLEYLSRSIPNIRLEDVKQKWKNVRTQYVQELRMMNHSKKSGSGKSDVYVPKLWCFSQLTFLKTNTRMRTSGDNVEENKLEDEVIIPEFSTEDESFSEEPPKKKDKRFEDIISIRKDLYSFRQSIIERKKEKKFAWLGTLVTNLMDEIEPDEQDDAAWQVQCLMHNLVRKKVKRERSSSSCSTSTKDHLELSMDGVFDEDESI